MCLLTAGREYAMQIRNMTRALRYAAIAALVGGASCVTRKVAPAAFDTITFERTPCFGTCPVFKVSVSGSGAVRFDGVGNVDSVGTYTGRIDEKSAAALRRAFDDAG